MYQIAICDDCASELNDLEDLIHTYINLHPEYDVSVHRFQSAFDLLAAIENRKRYNLYILDIIMPGANGIELGAAIRKSDASSAIVYLTSSPDFAVESYNVRARGYVLKPFHKQSLFPLLDEIISEMSAEDSKYLVFHTRTCIVTVPYGRLLYVQYYKHRLLCCLSDNSMAESVTLREPFVQITAPLLMDGRFLKISSSHIVNMQYIRTINAKSVQMSNKQELTITRAYKDARQKYLDFILERGFKI